MHRFVWALAGGNGAEFTKQACERVFEVTQGVPRLVNQICDFALVYAAMGEDKLVIASTIDQVIADGVYYPGFETEEAKNDE